VRRTVERHTRWAKLRRSLHPAGFVFEPLLSPLLVATVIALAAPSQVTWGAVTAVAALQTLVSLALVRLLRGTWLPWRYAPLEIARTYLAIACWLVAFVSMRIQWRGHPFLLKRGSVIVSAPASAWASLVTRVREYARTSG
jgi:ceramide glucosyltransferase